MINHKKSSLTLALFFALTLIPNPLTGSRSIKPVSAAEPSTTSSPVLPTVPTGTQVKIDGSNSLQTINQNLKARFEKNYSGTQVETVESGTDAALKSLEAGTIDLAAIGRPLTATEKAQGLEQVPISRHKIAIIVSPNNPIKGDITLEQFAKIFRGEIKNWSEIGGSAGAIKVIDRPETSDTRRSFSSYPVFEGAPLQAGENAVTLTEDDTDVVIKQLGNDGISYAIADQVKDRKDVKIVPMHKTLPSDPRYPFSQPLAYAYKGPNPNPSAKAFLCYANTSDYASEQAIVSTEFCGEEVASAQSAPIAPAPAPSSSWLGWLLLLPLIGLIGWFITKKRGSDEIPVVTAAAAPVGQKILEKPSRIILVPRNAESAYVYWEVPEAHKATLRRQGGERLTLKIHDATNLDLDTQLAHSTQEYDVAEGDQDRHVPIPTSDRDYVAELGYKTMDNRWLSLVRSLHVNVPSNANNLTNPMPGGGSALAGGAGLAGGAALAQGIEPLRQTGENESGSVSNVVEGWGETGGNALDSASGFVGGSFHKASDAGAAAVDKLKTTGESVRDDLSDHEPK